MSTVEGPGGHRYVVGRPARADGDHTERVSWPDEVAELVAERYRLTGRGLVVDEHAVPVLLDRVDAALVELGRRCPDAVGEVERVRRLLRPAPAAPVRRVLRVVEDFE